MEIVAWAGIFIGVVLFLACGGSGDSLDRYCRKCGVSLAAVFVLLLPGLAAAAVLEGRLSNQTPDGGKVSKVEVALLFTRNGQEEKLTATTDANGKFRFADLSPGEHYRVNLEYEGAEYGAAAEFDKTQDNLRIEISVYDSTSDPSSLRVKTHQVVFNPGKNSLRVEETLQVENAGQRAFIGSQPVDSQRRATIELTLPEGAAGYQYGNGLMECCVVAAPKGFVDTMDVKPGVREIVFSYTLPASSEPYRFIRRLDYTTDALNVLVGGGVSAKSPGLEAREAVQIQGVRYLQLAGKNLDGGTSMTVELADFPGRPVPFRYLVFAVLALILIAALVYVLVGRRK